MSRKVIITCAVTGGGDTVGKHPAIPVTPEEIAEASLGAARAGAAIVHLHVRDPQSGRPSMELDLYRRTVELIRGSDSEVLINLTTGAGARYMPSADNPAVGGPGTTLSNPGKRARHIEALRPALCSLDMGSMNFGEHVFVNTPGHLREMAAMARASAVMPELEVFEIGHIQLARKLIADGDLAAPAFFQLCLGVRWGVPATPEIMLTMINHLPTASQWSAFGVGRDQFPMAALSVLLGGHVRVGLEDNLYLAPGVMAPDNAALVSKAATIVRALDAEPATPGEARTILGLDPA